MRENNLSVSHLIYPMFVIAGDNIRQDISSMPGIQRLSIDQLLKDAKECFALGIPAVALFPVVEDTLKSHDAKECFNNAGLIPKAVEALKKSVPTLGVITDVALDPYTSDGQDGLTDKNGNIFVEELVPGGAAEQSGLISVGDRLIATSAIVFNSEMDYGGVSVKKGEEQIRFSTRGESFDVVMAAISTWPAPRKMKLEFQRCDDEESS